MSELCCFCRLPKAQLECECCQESVCKKCVHILDSETFAMLDTKPKELSYSKYCPKCFDTHIETALHTYNEVLERAKQVNFWPKTYKGNIPVLKKGREEISVEGMRDQKQALLKLGYKAAQLGFNSLIQGEIKSRKLRLDGTAKGYQTMEWSIRGWPALVDQDKLDRQEFREAHWRTLHHS